MFARNRKFAGATSLAKARLVSASLALLLSALAAHAQQPGAQTATPTLTPAPSANAQQPAAQSPPAGANARSASPDAQAQQSAQPVPHPQPQTPTGQQPAAGESQPGATLRLDAVPAFDQSNAQPPRTTNVPAPAGPRQPGRESVPAPAPAEMPLDVPPVAKDFRAAPGQLPELGRVGVNMAEQRPLALREAIELALRNAKEIEVARTNVRAAEFDLTAARGVYDPRLSSLSYVERTSTPVTSILSGASDAVTQTNFVGALRFEGLSPKAGGGYRFDFTSNRLTTNNQFTPLTPQFPSAFSFSYTQPLLRGRAFDQNRRAIEIAKKNLALTDAQFRQRAIETITQVQRAYWDLVFALRNLQIQRDAVRDARAQYEHNKRLVAEGMLAPIDVVAAEAQVSGFEQSVYTALDEVGRAENNLKNLIAETRQSEVWNVALVPTDTVDLASPPPVALDAALSAALSNRPELQQSDVVAAINELDQRLAREQTKTQLDLIASYGATGVAGALDPTREINPFAASNEALRDQINLLTARLNGLSDPDLPLLAPAPQGTLPDSLVGGYGQSLANLASNRYNNFRVGVQLNLPLRNRTAAAQLGRSLVERDRIRTQREQLEQLIQVDVRNALQVVRTAESRLRAAAVARDASERQYASELRKFDAGQSTIFLVLERQTALATARGNELRAQTELNKAAAELQRATGNSLEANQVTVSSR